MEAKTVIASITAREMIWIRRLFDSIWDTNNKVVGVVHTDNQPTEFNANNLQVTDKSKHMPEGLLCARHGSEQDAIDKQDSDSTPNS